MKHLQDFIITEERFSYTWENAFICAIKSIEDEKKAQDIMKKWFDDEDSARPLRTFLFRMGFDPKSDSPEDMYNSIKELPMDDKYNLGK